MRQIQVAPRRFRKDLHVNELLCSISEETFLTQILQKQPEMGAPFEHSQHSKRQRVPDVYGNSLPLTNRFNLNSRMLDASADSRSINTYPVVFHSK